MKSEKVIFIDDKLEKAFNELSDKDPIKKALIRAVESIKEDCQIGRNVKKKLIPKELIQKYNLDNLRIYNMPSSWRLIYTITTSYDVEIISILLDWMNHKDYEKLFKF